ncbi:MAG: hypothetical protein PHE09_21180 [Oscillospiraceae bacterium]|nr:hypothetical protein [Oscillospiraceae bacterium]
MIDESAHKVFDYGMKDWHDFRTHKCSHCSRRLDIYYCESRLYLVRCKHCRIVSLVEARNPNEAAEKVSHRAELENKALTLFDKITESPEKLAKFLGAIDIGKIELDECFCKSDCGDDSGCPHELQCIINWLDKPEGSENK